MDLIAPSDSGFDRALALLERGGLVAVPTETVYGLAADATNENAVASIYKAKGRPSFNPLIIHVDGVAMAKRFGLFNSVAAKLTEKFWPGPLTLVLPLCESHGLAKSVTAGLSTIAMRYPTGVMAQLAGALNRPLAAPSANSSGRISATTAQHVADDLGNKVDIILDGGECAVGLESTIVAVNTDHVTLLRAGGISREELEKVIGPVLLAQPKSEIQAPGMMLAHYAPHIPLRINVTGPLANGEVLLGFGDDKRPMALNLSVSGNLDEAAHNLFAMMQKLDKSGARAIAVAPIPTHGLGAAINDRLTRAAHGSKEPDATAQKAQNNE